MTSEMLAMLDIRLSDGRRYPTLDEYQEALDEIHRRERPQPNLARTVVTPTATWQPPTAALNVAPHQDLGLAALNVDHASLMAATRPLWFRIELESDGRWYPVQGTDSQIDEYLRIVELPRHQRAQPHVKYRIVAYRA